MHPCAVCASRQKTCCQRTEILLTRGDLDRIGAATGRADFHERRRPIDLDYLAHDPEDPDWLALTVAADGSRRMLRRRDDGDCIFLGTEGCVLTEETRPLVCRLYPFHYTSRGLDGVDEGYCPVELFRDRGATMVLVLGMKAEQAETWRRLLYAELRTEEVERCASA
ncbi:MAG: YkgJ family cysteine cluster protein [Planctomycetes bacterium]|nr:YkgJ family cysteine cluster protein [Planctomycetota bacterium]